MVRDDVVWVAGSRQTLSRKPANAASLERPRSVAVSLETQPLVQLRYEWRKGINQHGSTLGCLRLIPRRAGQPGRVRRRTATVRGARQSAVWSG